jgi:hypothetical protein
VRQTDDQLVGNKLLQYAQIAALKDKADWIAMCDQLKLKTDQVVKQIELGILRGVAFDQRQADYIRGWNAAAVWVSNLPKNAERQYAVLKAKTEG